MRELLLTVDSHELTEWMAYERLEPWGEERDDLRTGLIVSTIVNLFRKEGDAAVDPWDVMPDFAGDRRPARPEELTPEEIRERARALVKAMGGGGDGNDDR